MGLLLRRGQFPARWGFPGVEDPEARPAQPLKALSLIQATAGWQRRACQCGTGLISGFPLIGMAQEAHGTGLSEHEEGFARVTLLLAPVVFWWRFGSGRALHRPCGAIMPKRGVELLSISNMSAHSAAGRAGSRSWFAKA
jgi:hypothetical protein